jgi:hypothetical protein
LDDKGIFFSGNGMLTSENNNRIVYISETEAFNATHERWCQSKEFIRTSPLYGASEFIKIEITLNSEN